jgi:hypothetical protein
MASRQTGLRVIVVCLVVDGMLPGLFDGVDPHWLSVCRDERLGFW